MTAAPRTYRISLNPAEPILGPGGQPHGWRTSYSLKPGDPHWEVTAECCTFEEVRAAALALLAESGYAHASAYVRVVDGRRKPNGFDAWCDANRMISRPAGD